MSVAQVPQKLPVSGPKDYRKLPKRPFSVFLHMDKKSSVFGVPWHGSKIDRLRGSLAWIKNRPSSGFLGMDHITSDHITSDHIRSHHITSHHITPHHITPHHITSHHTTSHHITLHHTTSHDTKPHHNTSHHTTPHHIARSDVISYRTT